MAEPNFFALLSIDTGLASQVGARIYPDMVPAPGEMPAIVHQRMGADPRGASYCGAIALVLAHYQIAVYALSRAETKVIGDIVRDLLINFRGDMGGVTVKDAMLASDYDSVDPEPGLLCRTQLWDVWYMER